MRAVAFRMPVSLHRPQRSSIVVNGCTLSYLRAGRGEPLLVLHGEDGIWEWSGWMAELAERFDVIVPDHPAFGFSDWPDWLDNVHDVAYFYLDVLEALGLANVHIVGHSLGGWIACELAVRDRSRLRSLALVASGGIRLAGVPKLDRFIIPPEAVVRAGYADPSLAEAEVAVQRTQEEQDRDLRNRFAVARLQWQPRHDLSLPKWIHRIKVPTLIVWGDRDRIVPPAYAAEFARLIPGATIAMISECGHFPQIEQPASFIRTLTDFYEGLKP
jgi:pimeloyl-ACP methyl ester carboxylesterase